MSNPYDILGVGEGASDAELKKAYRKKSFELHPDYNSHPDAASQHKELQDAYKEVNTAEKRAARGGAGQSSGSANARNLRNRWLVRQKAKRDLARAAAKAAAKKAAKKAALRALGKALLRGTGAVGLFVEVCPYAYQAGKAIGGALARKAGYNPEAAAARERKSAKKAEAARKKAAAARARAAHHRGKPAHAEAARNTTWKRERDPFSGNWVMMEYDNHFPTGRQRPG